MTEFDLEAVAGTGNEKMESRMGAAGAAKSLKTEGGSWLDWRDAWREMGRTEEEIAEKEAADAAKRTFGDWRFSGRGDGVGASGDAGSDALLRRQNRVGGRVLRTWGKPLMEAVKRSRTCARMAYYIFSAQRRGWKWEEPLTFGELFRMAGFAVGGVLGRGRKYLWRLRAEVEEFVRNLWRREAKRGVEGRDGKDVLYPDCEYVNKSDGGSAECFRDVRGRVDETKCKGHLKLCGGGISTESIKAHAAAGARQGFAGARRAGSTESLREGDFEGSGGNACSHLEGSGGNACSPLGKVAGKLRGRGAMWRVMEAHHEALERAHGSNYWLLDPRPYSAAHLTAWLKACYAARKDLRAAARLYADAYDRALGAGYGGAAYAPRLFARLYREGAALPEFKKRTKEN